MPRNGAGTYTLISGNPVVTGTTISSTWANNTLSDMASALTQSVAKDGQTVMTNNLPMGGFKLTNLGAGSNAGDSVRYQQLFSLGVPLDIASAATVDIGGQNTEFLNVTGTVDITSFGTNYNGPRILTFSASLTLTHDATSLILPQGVNIETKGGDSAIVVPKATIAGTPDGWKVVSYLRYDNVPLINDTQTISSAATLDFTAAQAQFYSITGTTDVTAVTMYEAQPVYAIAAGAFKLVNSTSLAIQGGADYTCTVGDVLCFIKDGSGNVHVFGITPVRNTTNDPTWSSNSPSQAASTQWVNAKALIINSSATTLNGAAFYDFTSIPTGIKRLNLTIRGASTNGTTGIQVLIGDTVVATTGYVGSASNMTSTTNFSVTQLSTGIDFFNAPSATNTMSGIVRINAMDSNFWVFDGNVGVENATRFMSVAGSIGLTSALGIVRIKTGNGTDLFDGGVARITWEY